MWVLGGDTADAMTLAAVKLRESLPSTEHDSVTLPREHFNQTTFRT